MPGEGVAVGILAVPIWLAGTAAAVFVVAILLAVKRAGGVALITSLFRVGLIAAGVLGAWWLYVQQRDVSERRALDDRKTALMAGSIAPGSALSCLDELAGETVDFACEKAVFASPEAVASAVKYVTAQLALLIDGPMWHAATPLMRPNSPRCGRLSSWTVSASSPTCWATAMVARWNAATRWRGSAIRPACSAISATTPSRSK
jgi:hypothetical protein